MNTNRIDSTIRSGALCLALLAGIATLPATAAEMVERSDVWLESRLVTAYTLNRHLNPLELDVQVTDGVAVLSGQVDNAVEHDLAVEIANGIEGILRIDDRIRVKPRLVDGGMEATPSGEPEAGFATQVRDATITASVKMRLLWNRHTDGLDIDVTTHRGTVTLEGTVGSEVTRDLAGEIAANTHDVRDVDNRLRVNHAPDDETVGQKLGAAVDGAGEVITDTWITTKVHAVLDNHDDVDSSEIRVSTRDGVVVLTGKVGSAYERQRAPEIAADVKGVRQIDNRLTVSQRLSQGS